MSWGEGRGRQEWTPQHSGVVQSGYDWPGQDVRLFAVGLGVGGDGKGGREVERACKDSNERGRGPGTCRAVTGFETCGRQPRLRPRYTQGVHWYARAGPDHHLLQPSLKSAHCEPPGL